MDLVQQYSSSLHTLPDSITPWLRFGLGKPYTLNPNARQERDVYFAQGRRLLALTQADLYQLVDTKLDADLLSDAIHDLRLRAVRSPSFLRDWSHRGYTTAKVSTLAFRSCLLYSAYIRRRSCAPDPKP